MKLKVTLSIPQPFTGNPFRPSLMNETRDVEHRIWEIEAESEDAVKKFYNEAKEKCLPNVIGFELTSIDLVKAAK